jgi:trimethylamine:corrinoid methyltransferase-like protein
MESIKINKGGQLSNIEMNDLKILQTIGICTEEPKQIQLWLNESSLTYLSIEEAIDIRDGLNTALKQAIL